MKNKEWYKKWWGIIIAICVLPFFAIWYVWAKTKLSTPIKCVITFVVSLFIIISLLSSDKSNSIKAVDNNTVSSLVTPVVTPTSATKPTTGTPNSDATITPILPTTTQISVTNTLVPTTIVPSTGVPVEYKSALSKANSYSTVMHMSKQGIYDQLVSQYGEKFSPQAAQYAINNVIADWNANALAKAKTYQDTMSMSPAAIHDQLTSAYGEKFTKSEADYAIQHL